MKEILFNKESDRDLYNSPYSIRKLQQQIDSDRKAFDAKKEMVQGLTLREAMTSDDLLTDFVPKLFVDEITMLGLRVAQAREHFAVVPQSTHDSFTVRFREKADGAQVLGEEDEIKHDSSERETITYKFSKIAQWPLWSMEALMDSPLAETTDELLLSSSKIFRRENQMMWHRLTEFSQGALATKWDNFILLAGTTSDDIQTAMENAYLDMTNALEDRFDQASLTWFISPTVFSLLYKDADFRRFDILGQSPTFLTGKLPNIQGIPYVIIEPGHFELDNINAGLHSYNPNEFDIYLVAPQFAASIRERVALRLDQTATVRNQTQGIQLWERLSPYVKNPKAYRRISQSQSYSAIAKKLEDVRIRPQTD